MFGKSFFVASAIVALAALTSASMAEEPQQAGAQMGGTEMTDAASSNPDLAFGAVWVSHARLQRQISELVAQKATNPQIKQLAQESADFYEKFSQRIQQAASKSGITLHPDRMLPRDQAILNHLQQVPANRLERDYLFYQAGANQTDLLFAEWAANNAQKPGIKQAATDIVPQLRQRVQKIQDMAKSEVGGSK